MHRSQPRSASVRDRRPPQPLLVAPAQPAELTPRQHVRAALPTVQRRILPALEWAHTWRATHSAGLDK